MVLSRSALWGRLLLFVLAGPGSVWAETRPSAAAKGDSPASPEPDEPGVEVVVPGDATSPARSSEDPEVSSFVLGREALDPAGRSLGDALRSAPGVQVTQLGGLGSPTTARLRGATSAQTPVYFGDVRLNDEVGGVADLGLIPPAFVESIRVYRSHAPRLGAELGIGGAIVMKPRRPRTEEARLRTDVGSYAFRNLSLEGGARSQARELSVGVSVDAADNDYSFLDTRGTLFVPNDDVIAQLKNADTNGLGVWLRGVERFGSAQTEVFFAHATREQGAPKLALLPTREARVRYERTLTQVTTTFDQPWGELKLLTSAVGSTTLLSDPLLELGATGERIETPGERLEQAVGSIFELGRHWSVHERLSVSLERFRRYEEREAGALETAHALRSTFRAASGLDFQPFPALSVGGLVEARCIATTPLGESPCKEAVPAGRIHIASRLGAWEFYGSTGAATRIPTLSELFGISSVVRGNAALRPEHAMTSEVGVRYATRSHGSLPRLWFDLSGYHRDSSDLILFVRTAQGYLTSVNRAKSRTLGAELALGVGPVGPFSWTFSGSLLDPRDTSPGRMTQNDFLPFLSAFTASSELSTVVVQSRWLKWKVDLRGFYQSRRFGDPAGLGVIPEQANLDLETELRLWRGALIARGSARNLVDSRRFDVVGFPLPGRSFFLSLEANFS